LKEPLFGNYLKCLIKGSPSSDPRTRVDEVALVFGAAHIRNEISET
jgi:hypothetical protein